VPECLICCFQRLQHGVLVRRYGLVQNRYEERSRPAQAAARLDGRMEAGTTIAGKAGHLQRHQGRGAARQVGLDLSRHLCRFGLSGGVSDCLVSGTDGGNGSDESRMPVLSFLIMVLGLSGGIIAIPAARHTRHPDAVVITK